MFEQLPAAPLDDAVATAFFERNIRNSRDVIAGEFENVLADIIEQLSTPIATAGGIVPASEVSRRIAHGLREGFAGLPPNGFDFCTWLWSVAALHDVQIPQANEIGASHGFRYGVVHLRKIAVMVAEVYVDAQPQKIESMLPLIDASTGWVDARNLIIFGLLGYYTRHFEQEYAALLELTRETRRWRRLVPLAVGARMIVVDASWTSMALALLASSFHAVDDENVRRAIAFELRAASMYGDHAALAAFITAQADTASPVVRSMLCDVVRLAKYDWSHTFADRVRPVLTAWRTRDDGTLAAHLDLALHHLSR